MNYFRYLDDATYRRWIKAFDTLTGDQKTDLEQTILARSTMPRIAVVPLSIETARQEDLAAFAASLRGQIYKNWHICSTRADPDHVTCVCVNAASLGGLLKQAAETADFVLPLPIDSRLPSHALALLILALDQIPEAALLYGDEDLLLNGKRSRPRFKTDWDPFLMLGRNLIGVPALYCSRAIVGAELDGLAGSTIENVLYALALTISASVQAPHIVHVPAILCHRMAPAAWNAEEGRDAVRAFLAGRGIQGAKVVSAPLAPQWNRVIFPLPAPTPLVSIIIATRDRAELIGPCLDGILGRTDYPSIEVLVVDNGTSAPDALHVLERAKRDPRVKTIRDDRPFNYSQLNNFAMSQARGEIIVLLNNDTDVIHADWLSELVSLAARPEIGVVGAKLLYADSRIQHAGVILGPNSDILHQLRRLDGADPGPEGELALLRSVSAVTGACLAMRRALYLDLGGLNETEFPVAYNDIDLCTRVVRRGLAVVWTPHAKLFHLESMSRGAPYDPGRADHEFSENMRFWMMNADFYERPDPFHNPQITFLYDHVELARPPRSHPLRHTARSKETRLIPSFY